MVVFHCIVFFVPPIIRLCVDPLLLLKPITYWHLFAYYLSFIIAFPVAM